MTTDRIENAVRAVVARCNAQHPGLHPPSGSTVMKWLLDELEMQKVQPREAGPDFPIGDRNHLKAGNIG